jgi:hypothetical protein
MEEENVTFSTHGGYRKCNRNLVERPEERRTF